MSYRAYKWDEKIKNTRKDGSILYRSDFVVDTVAELEEFKKKTKDYPAGTTYYCSENGESRMLNGLGEYKEV